MILAAGLGSRMRPLTDHCPKPLLDVAGKPLIVRHIERLAAARFTEIVINTAHLGQMIRERLADGAEWNVHIVYSNEAQPLETAGGIVNALPLLGDAPFLVLNGDIWCDFPLGSLHKVLQKGLGHLVLVNNPDHNPAGDFVLNTGQLAPRGNGRGYTFSGLSVLHPQLFADWRSRSGEAFPLREVLLPAMATGDISGELYDGYWLDVGTPQRLQLLNQRLTSMDNADYNQKHQ
jgi:MurNAc alpha-1-phosphate uridylyltransferase